MDDIYGRAVTDGWTGGQRNNRDVHLGDVGEFPHFPNYKTIDENLLPPWSLTQLTPRQVNLLADLTCWVVLQHRSTIEQFVAAG